MLNSSSHLSLAEPALPECTSTPLPHAVGDSSPIDPMPPKDSAMPSAEPQEAIARPISVDYLLDGLEFPAYLDRQVALKVASAYADDNFNIFRAEVEIARRTYHKHSLAARVAKMHLLKLEKKLDKAAHDATWFHVQANAVPAIDDPEWVTASAEFRDPQAPNNSDTVFGSLGNAL